MNQAATLPRLYSSSEDALFEEDDDIEPTAPRVGAPESGVRAFFETIVRELESTETRRSGR